ncbi:MAG: sporulation protein YtfJ [Clostridia bacterium]|nr:sporulation protein YtfJ [Clostridia bacterium]
MKFENDKQSINDLIGNAMEKIKTIVDSSTIVGDGIRTDGGVTIIPISKVCVGFVVGGGEYADLSARRVANHFPMSGGSSGGMSVSPVGFLILQPQGGVEFVNVENKSLYQTVLNMFNSLLSKIEQKQKDKEKETVKREKESFSMEEND